MSRKLTEEDGRQALRDHVLDRAVEARKRYGERIDYASFLRVLQDPHVVRYPTNLAFSDDLLQDGELAHAQPLGGHPRDGFTIVVHPRFQGRDDVVPLVAAYQIVCINYGDIATHVEAELFGATLLGIDVEEYYRSLCALADEVGANGSCAG